MKKAFSYIKEANTHNFVNIYIYKFKIFFCLSKFTDLIQKLIYSNFVGFCMSVVYYIKSIKFPKLYI